VKRGGNSADGVLVAGRMFNVVPGQLRIERLGECGAQLER
jgi:hypothetical protein